MQRKMTILTVVVFCTGAIVLTYTKNVITSEAILRGDFRYTTLSHTPLINLWNTTYRRGLRRWLWDNSIGVLLLSPVVDIINFRTVRTHLNIRHVIMLPVFSKKEGSYSILGKFSERGLVSMQESSSLRNYGSLTHWEDCLNRPSLQRTSGIEREEIFMSVRKGPDESATSYKSFNNRKRGITKEYAEAWLLLYFVSI